MAGTWRRAAESLRRNNGRRTKMKWLNVITLLLAIVGGLNWGLVAIGGYNMDLVANLFGGADSGLARIVYGLVGLSALWQIVPFVTSMLSTYLPDVSVATGDMPACVRFSGASPRFR